MTQLRIYILLTCLFTEKVINAFCSIWNFITFGQHFLQLEVVVSDGLYKILNHGLILIITS